MPRSADRGCAGGLGPVYQGGGGGTGEAEERGEAAQHEQAERPFRWVGFSGSCFFCFCFCLRGSWSDLFCGFCGLLCFFVLVSVLCFVGGSLVVYYSGVDMCMYVHVMCTTINIIYIQVLCVCHIVRMYV